ncbi:MAG: glutamate--tRNA ligase [Eudoraea sp.]|uniref:glutamate--tRNA ligase n=1 Tax=Eudoraea sp. TaxID=1979955 RepID=UPI003C747453
MDKNNVRVRFAPSPTGPLHIGGLRTAIYNYLFAKQNHGSFILRIEDTDLHRYVEGAEEYIVNSLNWLGIPFDEGPGKEEKVGPYRQSERKLLYRQYAERLINEGKAYYAYDTAESLDEHRKNHELKGKTFIYNWHNRKKLNNSLTLSQEEIALKKDKGEPYVIRFFTPADRTIVLNDLIRGEIEIDTNILDDKILFKSDGMPTYHLANIVDDHLMKISHVIRGEEWLPSLALHYLLYEAFNWEAPTFAHLPLILKPEGKGKLSKRDGEKGGFPVFPLNWHDSIGYKEAGYFPDSLLNYLSLLGWNPGTEQEIFSKEELITLFKIDKVHKAGARFDPEKTKWYNHQYLQKKTSEELALDFVPILNSSLIPSLAFDIKYTSKLEYLEKVVSLLKERAFFVKDFWELGEYFFHTPQNYNEKATKKRWKTTTSPLLKELYDLLKDLSDFSSATIEEKTKNWISENNLSFGEIMPPLRIAIVGDLKGPHLFDIMDTIGKTESLNRLNIALKKL